ncbi:MAG TPA: hypothetical protein VGL16_04125 [Actinomycetota bacterium]|jgi:hypothetical protein
METGAPPRDRISEGTGVNDGGNEPRGGFTEEEYDNLVWSRGIRREVAEGAFLRYQQGDIGGVLAFDPTIEQREAEEFIRGLVNRAPGLVLRRWPVPGADEFITAELRPDWPVWTGAMPSWTRRHSQLEGPERSKHVMGDKVTADDVRRATTTDEYQEWRKWALERSLCLEEFGADHFGVDTEDDHLHFGPIIAKYLFQAAPLITIVEPGTPHSNADMNGFFPRYYHHERRHTRKRTRSFKHPAKAEAFLRTVREKWWARLDEVVGARPYKVTWWEGHYSDMEDKRELAFMGDVLHPHFIRVKDRDVVLARRLSIHPMSRERLQEVHRVFFALEGCLKEAALVSAGETTFSCPSVSLWNASELENFARHHLGGKRVFVVCDSDWDRADDDSVVLQALLARDRLRSFGIDAHAAAPPPGGKACEHKDKKHGVDDHLGPCPGEGTVDDLLVIVREAAQGLTEWLANHPPRGDTRNRADGRKRDGFILRWLSTHAGSDGVTTVSDATIAKALQPQLGSPTTDAARRAVERGIRSLIKRGAIEEVEPRKERVRWHFRKEYRDWSAKLRVAEQLRGRQAVVRLGDFPSPPATQ